MQRAGVALYVRLSLPRIHSLLSYFFPGNGHCIPTPLRMATPASLPGTTDGATVKTFPVPVDSEHKYVALPWRLALKPPHAA